MHGAQVYQLAKERAKRAKNFLGAAFATPSIVSIVGGLRHLNSALR